MRLARILTILIALTTLTQVSQADPVPVEVGGDRFVAGPSVTERGATGRDLLAMGASLHLSGEVSDDVHAMGFDVEIDGDIGGDIVAAGASVTVGGQIAGDLTASAMTLRTERDAVIGGNARLAAATVTIEGTVAGALVAAGAEITLNAPVAGDVSLTGAVISFGPDARIDGTLTYTSDEPITVPAGVIDPARVTFQPASNSEMWQDFRDEWDGWDSPVSLSPIGLIGGFMINLALFIVIGAVFLTLMPGTIRRLRRSADARPGMVILTGTIGLSILFGAVPVAVLTIVGLALVPIVLLLIILVWLLGYILGAYVFAMQVMRGFGASDSPSTAMRLLALAVGVTFMALLNFIPVIGWLVNFALVLLGIGAITTALFDRFVANLQPDLDQSLAPLDTSDT